ncbi:MAG: DUF3854 domain-containing protein [Cyanobacteriota bacterium]|nr:DUF3854 domain-containing protein [Cyanobacteriota bacterium]
MSRASFEEQSALLPQISIILTEGEKKAAALLSRGEVAIALPGIYCGTVRDGNSWRLHPDLVHWAQKRRNFYILFDYEPKADKARHLARATVRLGKAIESEGSSCHVAHLPGPEKGIDDWLVALLSRLRIAAAARLRHPVASLASLWVGLVKGFSSPRLDTTTAVRDLLAAALPFRKDISFAPPEIAPLKTPTPPSSRAKWENVAIPTTPNTESALPTRPVTSRSKPISRS